MSSFMESLRRLSSGGAKEPETSSGPTSPRNNVWSSTFDPGRNSNIGRKVGASYYDKPTEENKGDIWSQHLQSQSSRPKSIDEPKPSGTAMDAESVRRMFASDKIESAMKQADAGAGKVDYEKFMSLLRQQ